MEDNSREELFKTSGNREKDFKALMAAYRKNELRGSSMTELCISDDLYNGKRAVALIKNAASGKTLSFEWLNKRKDGTMFYSDNVLKHVNIAGEDRVLAIVRDITEKNRNRSL